MSVHVSNVKVTILEHMILATEDTTISPTGITMMRPTETETPTIISSRILPGKQTKMKPLILLHMS